MGVRGKEDAGWGGVRLGGRVEGEYSRFARCYFDPRYFVNRLKLNGSV